VSGLGWAPLANALCAIPPCRCGVGTGTATPAVALLCFRLPAHESANLPPARPLPAAPCSYRARSLFLADINAESSAAPAPPHYRANLASLAKLVLFIFDDDVTVVPKESAWFAWFDGEALVPMERSALYVEDRIGLRELDEGGRLVLAHAPGFHMQFSLEWFGEHVVWPHLAVPAAAGPAGGGAGRAGGHSMETML
jgi:hypothetical protein